MATLPPWSDEDPTERELGQLRIWAQTALEGGVELPDPTSELALINEKVAAARAATEMNVITARLSEAAQDCYLSAHCAALRVKPSSPPEAEGEVVLLNVGVTLHDLPDDGHWAPVEQLLAAVGTAGRTDEHLRDDFTELTARLVRWAAAAFEAGGPVA